MPCPGKWEDLLAIPGKFCIWTFTGSLVLSSFINMSSRLHWVKYQGLILKQEKNTTCSLYSQEKPRTKGLSIYIKTFEMPTWEAKETGLVLMAMLKNTDKQQNFVRILLPYFSLFNRHLVGMRKGKIISYKVCTFQVMNHSPPGLPFLKIL